MSGSVYLWQKKKQVAQKGRAYERDFKSASANLNV